MGPYWGIWLYGMRGLGWGVGLTPAISRCLRLGSRVSVPRQAHLLMPWEGAHLPRTCFGTAQCMAHMWPCPYRLIAWGRRRGFGASLPSHPRVSTYGHRIHPRLGS